MSEQFRKRRYNAAEENDTMLCNTAWQSEEKDKQQAAQRALKDKRENPLAREEGIKPKNTD